jgi:uncharacterized protein (TIGR00661 family)
MARILYGVHTTGQGHVLRALTVARNFPEHEFFFVCQGSKANLLLGEYPVEEIPSPDTVIRGHKVALAATVLNGAKVLVSYKRWLRRVVAVIESFKPDLALADMNFFVGLAARETGLPCVSLDHGHILTCCRLPVPFWARPRVKLDQLAIELLYSNAFHYLIATFFRPPLKTNAKATLVGPILRRSVLTREPSDAGHVLAFKSFSAFEALLPILRNLSRRVVVYGYDRQASDGNLEFKKRSDEGFLDDLAACSYLICGGGHTVVSEALHYGKPVLCFPGYYFEQELSAHYVDRLGYGLRATGHPRPNALMGFEARLDNFRQNISDNSFCGNEEAFARLEEFFRGTTP